MGRFAIEKKLCLLVVLLACILVAGCGNVNNIEQTQPSFALTFEEAAKPFNQNNGQIPMWLSVGIKVKGGVDAGLFTPDHNFPIHDNFGDLLFLPSNWQEHGDAEVINTAYRFARFIYKAGRLDELLDLYNSIETDSADALATQLFSDFSGDLNLCTQFRLSFPPHFDFWGRNQAFSQAFWITTSTSIANYAFFFSEPDGSHNRPLLDRLVAYIPLIDDVITFVYEWYVAYLPYADYEHFGFRPINIALHDCRSASVEWAMGYTRGDDMFAIYQLRDNLEFLTYYLIWIAAHEATHIMSARSLGYRNFFTLEEGLASALPIFYMQQYRPHVARDVNSYHLWAYQLLFHFDTLPLQLQEDILMHRRNFSAQNSFNHANCYDTSRSFTLYLIENFGGAMYMQVLFTPENFQDVYGVTAEEMVGNWKGFLLNEIHD
ncbi:MAG: hypothetical protein FWB98_08385 [Defluviitaleaceae bacterium]|nr:hypothetical protein [Defluviitaleaceae bacterium]